ncbi:MAG TPA: hypothetical protein VFW97_18595 [Acidimicrobiia bacterium]|jgi:hypothetical protein|nr:hypothetical protein [Acidimicrobiia bacterium]
MPFFEPLSPLPDEPPAPRPTGWRPPVWDRPSEAVLGSVVPATTLLARTDDSALALDELRAYPNGFTCSLVILRNPMAPRDPTERFGPMHMHPMAMRGPRLGFEFSDGSVARVDGARHAPPPAGANVQLLAVSRAQPGNPFGIATDDFGVPTSPVLLQRGGGGGGDRYEIRFWCFPLPPPGRMTIHADWVDRGVDEVSIPFDADLIRDAAAAAVTIWEADE